MTAITPTRATLGYSVGSLTLGVAGILQALMLLVDIANVHFVRFDGVVVSGLIAIVFGVLALRKERGGRLVPIAGIALGAVSLVFALLAFNGVFGIG